MAESLSRFVRRTLLIRVGVTATLLALVIGVVLYVVIVDQLREKLLLASVLSFETFTLATEQRIKETGEDPATAARWSLGECLDRQHLAKNYAVNPNAAVGDAVFVRLAGPSLTSYIEERAPGLSEPVRRFLDSLPAPREAPPAIFITSERSLID